MIKIIEGDLLDSGAYFICHQVNCQGAMNSGVAKAIRDRYPVVFDEYKIVCDKYRDSDKYDLMGNKTATIDLYKYV